MVALYGTVFCVAGIAAAAKLQVDTSIAVAEVPEEFLGFGFEMDGFLDGVAEGKWTDPVFQKVVSHLAPFKLRLGGITGDFVRYEGFLGMNVSLSDLPTEEKLFTPTHWSALKSFAKNSGARVVFMLNELHGRDCSLPNERCAGDWDTRNVARFLSAVKDDYGDWLAGFELGNELTNLNYRPHLTLQDTIDDLHKLRAVGESVFSQLPEYVASSTDYCGSNQPEEYLQGTAGVLGAYSFHSYPGTDGGQMPGQLLDLAWLRNNILQDDKHANVGECVSAATGFPNVAAYLTESNSVYAYHDCFATPTSANPCHMKSFKNGFWYVASLGQFAHAGVQLHARWCLSEYIGSPFNTILRDGNGAVSVVTDYWVAVLHKRLMGTKVLDASLSDADAGLAYAACAADGSGGVVVMYANPSATAQTFAPPDGWDSYQLFALTGEDMSIHLNGRALALTAGGELPTLQPTSGSGDVEVPGLSYGFIQFPDVAPGLCAAQGPPVIV